MATFLDEDTNNPEEAEQFDTLDSEEVNELEDSDLEQPSEEEEDDIPDKYKGKSVKDIVRMHQEAEKAMGKQGSEVGELRRLVDDFIRAQTVTQQAPTVEEEVDFFSDPDQAIAKAIEKHPKVQQAEQLALQMRQTEAINNLKTAHPDFQEVIADEGFKEWIGKSKVRQELFNRANSSFDFYAADELLSTWKERSQVVQQATEVEKASRKSAVKAASTGSSRGTGESSRKIYRRADIIELMQTNPDRYQALSGEIMKAYAEGRVK